MLKKSSLSFLVLLMACSVAFTQNNRAEVILNGVNMVPDVQTAATGTAQAWIESDTLYVSGKFSNLQSYYYASNIHYGEEGETGNPIYKLQPDISEDRTSGSFNPEKNVPKPKKTANLNSENFNLAQSKIECIGFF